MRSVWGKWLVVEQHKRNDVGCLKAYKQQDCMVAESRYTPGSSGCMLMGCIVATGFERTAEGCRATGAEVNSGAGAVVDSRIGLDHT